MAIVDCWHRVSTTSTTWLYHDTALKLLIGNVNNALHGIRLQGGGVIPICPVVTTATAVKILTINFSQFDRWPHKILGSWPLLCVCYAVCWMQGCTAGIKVLWWVCCKLKWYFDCWPAAKNLFWPLTALWPRSQLWLQRIWEWPSPWAGQMGNCFVSDSVQNLARTTQRTNTRQVSTCSQEPVDSTDANIVGTSTSLKTIR